MYERGIGVPKNHVKAFHSYRQCLKDNTNEELYREVKERIENLRSEWSKRCGSCGKLASRKVKMTQCARCFSMWYCSKECQSKDWKEGGHKVDCKKVE